MPPEPLEPAWLSVDTGVMAPGLGFAIAVALPTAFGFALVAAARVWRWASERPRRNQPPSVRPLERVCADLRRLRMQLEALENEPPRPHKALRVRAVRAAYVDALLDACRRLDVESARPEGNNQAGIYRLEDTLRRHGVDVRTRLVS